MPSRISGFEYEACLTGPGIARHVLNAKSDEQLLRFSVQGQRLLFGGVLNRTDPLRAMELLIRRKAVGLVCVSVLPESIAMLVGEAIELAVRPFAVSLFSD